MVPLALALLVSVDTFAATIEQYSLRQIGDAVELRFQMRGTARRWHLHSHGQELWLELYHSRVNPLLNPASLPIAAPLTRVGIDDFGGGKLRLILRVRGQVDYAVAQMPQALVVRIASAEHRVDLTDPLLHELERRSPATLARSSSVLEPTLDQSGIAENRAPIPTDAVNLPNRPATLSTIPEPSRSPLPKPAAPPVVSGAGGYSSQTPVQPVQPVAQYLGPVPGIGRDTRPAVVVDAGHGGFDPGTQSAGGIAEKTVALAIARQLAATLQSRGIDAELTRDDDRFLRLGARTDFANHAHADLFVSIHLNWSPDWQTSGIETYYLNNTTDRATIRLAQMENGGDYSTFGESNLNYILTNLRQDFKAHESSSLARLIEADVATSIDSMLGTRVNALGAKKGPFYVLVGAEMPSVLIECGFLSNPREAQLLARPSYQNALAEGIAVAISHYFNANAAVGNL